MKILLSCEHGGNDIPDEYKRLFDGATDVLASHRGYDYGALALYKKIRAYSHPDFEYYATISRLLVDLNRSVNVASLFSEFTQYLDSQSKNDIISKYYMPYRDVFAKASLPWFKAGDNVLHLSIHSFTPLYNGVVRNADIGILYDPSFAAESCFARILKRQINGLLPHLNVRFNYPYLGKTDGHVVFYRKQYKGQYAGIELEMGYNCAYPEVIDKLAQAVAKACALMRKHF